jgi:hypothetical protein
MDAHHLDLSMLPRERRRFLATLGRRSTVQGLERRGERRYPIWGYSAKLYTPYGSYADVGITSTRSAM